MDDERIYGQEFFWVNFSYAVRNGLLTDYKVLVLTVSEDMNPDTTPSKASAWMANSNTSPQASNV